jgi:hypothetical protein
VIDVIFSPIILEVCDIQRPVVHEKPVSCGLMKQKLKEPEMNTAVRLCGSSGYV